MGFNVILKRTIAVSLQLVMGLFLCASPPAHADDWGCQVLLCLSNPKGPEAVGQCVPPIEKLYHALAHGDPFPSCSQAGAGNYAQPTENPYNPCPQGLTEAPAGQYVIQGTAQTIRGAFQADGNGVQPMPSQTGTYGGQPGSGALACVGNQVGTYEETVSTDNDGDFRDGDATTVQVQVYDTVVWQQPQSPNAIDVYVDSSLYTRVHY